MIQRTYSLTLQDLEAMRTHRSWSKTDTQRLPGRSARTPIWSMASRMHRER